MNASDLTLSRVIDVESILGCPIISADLDSLGVNIKIYAEITGISQHIMDETVKPCDVVDWCREYVKQLTQEPAEIYQGLRINQKEIPMKPPVLSLMRQLESELGGSIFGQLSVWNLTVNKLKSVRILYGLDYMQENYVKNMHYGEFMRCVWPAVYAVLFDSILPSDEKQNIITQQKAREKNISERNRDFYQNIVKFIARLPIEIRPADLVAIKGEPLTTDEVWEWIFGAIEQQKRINEYAVGLNADVISAIYTVHGIPRKPDEIYQKTCSFAEKIKNFEEKIKQEVKKYGKQQ